MKYDIEKDIDFAVDAAIEKIEARRNVKNRTQTAPTAAVESMPVSQPEGASFDRPSKPVAQVSQELINKVLAKLTETDRTKYHAIPTASKKAEFIQKAATSFGVTEE
jgi:hypothetical protein